MKDKINAPDQKSDALVLLPRGKESEAQGRLLNHRLDIILGRLVSPLETHRLDDDAAKRRKAVEAMTSDMVAEELTLRALRQAHRLTQEEVAGILGINQNAVSKLEKRSDLLLSTLSRYVVAMGGRLNLVAEFPDRPPVSLKGLGDLVER